MQKFKSVEELVNQLKPDRPVYCIRKKSILSAANFFKKKFPGKILFAVKTNPHPEVIKTLIKSGIDQFDVASIEEIKAVRKFIPNFGNIDISPIIVYLLLWFIKNLLIEYWPR